MWKEQLLNTKNTIRTDIIDVPEEDNCNRQLKAYADKLKNMKPKLKVEGVSPSIHHREENEKGYALRISDNWHGVEVMNYKYNPIPEEVACKALEILNSGSSQIIEDFGGYRILLLNNDNHDLSYGSIFSDFKIIKNSEAVLHLTHYIKTGSKRDNNIREVDTRWWK